MELVVDVSMRRGERTTACVKRSANSRWAVCRERCMIVCDTRWKYIVGVSIRGDVMKENDS